MIYEGQVGLDVARFIYKQDWDFYSRFSEKLAERGINKNFSRLWHRLEFLEQSRSGSELNGNIQINRWDLTRGSSPRSSGPIDGTMDCELKLGNKTL